MFTNGDQFERSFFSPKNGYGQDGSMEGQGAVDKF